MTDTNPAPLATVHRLLFDAFVELRAAGHESGDKRVFHLADLFHRIAFDLQSAAEGGVGYDEVLRRLAARAEDKGCGRWLEAALDRIGSAPPDTSTDQPHQPADGTPADRNGLRGAASAER